MVPVAVASSAMTGRSMLAVAPLEISSVVKEVMRETRRRTAQGAKEEKELSWMPNQVERPETVEALAKEKPPPRSKRRPQGMKEVSVFQSRMGVGSSVVQLLSTKG